MTFLSSWGEFVASFYTFVPESVCEGAIRGKSF